MYVLFDQFLMVHSGHPVLFTFGYEILSKLACLAITLLRVGKAQAKALFAHFMVCMFAKYSTSWQISPTKDKHSLLYARISLPIHWQLRPKLYAYKDIRGVGNCSTLGRWLEAFQQWVPGLN